MADRTDHCRQLLYEQTLAARSDQQSLICWLLGAYDWSELFVHLSRTDQLDSVLTWEAIHKTLEKAAESNHRSVQKQLAGRIGWVQSDLPFEYLLRLSEHRNAMLRDQVRHYFAREAREWSYWLKWRADMLVLTVD